MRTSKATITRVKADLDDSEVLALHLTSWTTVVVAALTVDFAGDWRDCAMPLKVTVHGTRRQDKYPRRRDWEFEGRAAPRQLQPLIGRLREEALR